MRRTEIITIERGDVVRAEVSAPVYRLGDSFISIKNEHGRTYLEATCPASRDALLKAVLLVWLGSSTEESDETLDELIRRAFESMQEVV